MVLILTFLQYLFPSFINLFFQGKSSCDLEFLLNLLSAPNVRQLAKDFNLKPKGTQKADFTSAILKHSRQKSFFTVGKSLAKKVEEK